MAFEEIGIGTIPNDTEGDTLRAGGIKINNNFAKAVEGPASSNDNRLALFSGTSGKEVKQAAFDVDDVARLSATQTITGAKTFSQTSTTVATTATFLNPSNANNTTKEAQILFRLADTVGTFKNTAAVSSFPDNVNATEAGMRFLVRVGNNETLVERMRIAANGTVQLPSGSPGIKFGTRNANLADYEEGTFTPTVIGTTTAGVGTYTAQNGYYTKIGNLVYFHIYIVVTSHTGTGNIRVSGLPFTAANKTQAFSIGSVRYGNLTLPANTIQIASVVVVNSTVLGFDASRDNNTAVGVAIDTAWDAYITGTYQTT